MLLEKNNAEFATRMANLQEEQKMQAAQQQEHVQTLIKNMQQQATEQRVSVAAQR
jgi:hypothetical protein